MADKTEATRVDERRLIQSARRGNADAFARLYRAHVQVIYRYIYLRVNNPHLAEDLTGDVFMRALKSIETYQDQGKPFVAWLYRIAHARVVDYYRQAGRHPAECDIEAEPILVSTDMDVSLLRRQAAKALREAIRQLTADQQQVVILRFIEGHSLESAAQMMGKNANAIKALQHRALRTLANKLSDAGFDIEAVLAGLSS